MNRDEIARRLMATFLDEAEDVVRALNRDLSALEKAPVSPERAAVIHSLFRSAHCLKGAARAVTVKPIEAACHALESILSEVRDGARPLGADLMELIAAAADAIGEAVQRLRERRDLAGAPLLSLLPRISAAAAPTPGEPATPFLPPPSPPPQAPDVLPTAAPLVPLAPPAAGEGSFRVQADKLDTLLSRSGELLVVRERLEAHGGDFAALQDFVERWEADFRSVQKPLRRLLQGTAGGQKLTPLTGSELGRAYSTSRRIELWLGRMHADFRRLRKDVDRMASVQLGDRRALRQVASLLEDEIRSVRMIPFSEACAGLERVARDIASGVSKEVELSIEGGDVELDRAIIDALKAPLMHLLRNAIDHGLETPAARLKIGKAARGRILVSAHPHGPQVEIRVQDDGAGLDIAAIRQQVRKRNLAEPPLDRELCRVIFQPGFSTAPVLTDLSGRGVGLDVVRTQVERLRGAVEVASEPGKGACFTITVPVTLITIRALLCTAGDKTFAIPCANVQKLMRLAKSDLLSLQGEPVICVAGRTIPVRSLAASLGLRAAEKAQARRRAPVVIVSAGDKWVAFVVDELLAEQEVLVKSLGFRLAGLSKVSGATLLADGQVALILNAAGVLGGVNQRGPAAPIPGELGEAAAAVRKRVLVVDDVVTTRSLVKSLLESAGYEVLVAADGADAWRLLQDQGADLLVSDVEMPRMDGFELVRTVRASPRWARLPVILVTGLDSERHRARGVEVGANAYIVKSGFDQKGLLAAMAQLL